MRSLQWQPRQRRQPRRQGFNRICRGRLWWWCSSRRRGAHHLLLWHARWSKSSSEEWWQRACLAPLLSCYCSPSRPTPSKEPSLLLPPTDLLHPLSEPSQTSTLLTTIFISFISNLFFFFFFFFVLLLLGIFVGSLWLRVPLQACTPFCPCVSSTVVLSVDSCMLLIW